MEIEAGDAVGAVLHKGDGVTEKITAWPGDGKGVVCQVAEKPNFSQWRSPRKAFLGEMFMVYCSWKQGCERKEAMICKYNPTQTP